MPVVQNLHIEMSFLSVEAINGGTTRLEKESRFPIHSRKLTAGYQRWWFGKCRGWILWICVCRRWFGKGGSFQIWPFLVSICQIYGNPYPPVNDHITGWKESPFSIGNTSSIWFHFPASYVSLPEGSHLDPVRDDGWWKSSSVVELSGCFFSSVQRKHLRRQQAQRLVCCLRNETREKRWEKKDAEPPGFFNSGLLGGF